MPYCPRCGTALSSHEVALGYEDVVDPSVYVRFPLLDDPAVSLLAWTTMPWTLVPHAAIAVDPEVTYVRARLGDERLILAEALVERVLGEEAEIEERMPGSALLGLRYEPPFPYISDYGERGHTVLAGDFVSVEDGTGVVHTGAAFGEDDFRLAQDNGLTIHNPVRPDGTFDERAGPVRRAWTCARRTRRSSRRCASRGASSAPASTSTPTRTAGAAARRSSTTPRPTGTCARPRSRTSCSRRTRRSTGTRSTSSTGASATGSRTTSTGRSRASATGARRCRSGAADGRRHVVCVGSRAELRGARRPRCPTTCTGPTSTRWCCAATAARTMRRVPDLIDVWWDSGCMPFAQWHAPFENEDSSAERFPADYICEALDQTRGWFYSLLAVSTLLFGQSSYETVLCLGLILDPDGQKMSKSKGNVVVPWDVIDAHGADAFRWYYFTSKQPWDGYRFSLETVGESVRQFLKTLWNTYALLRPLRERDRRRTARASPRSSTAGSARAWPPPSSA